MSDEQETLKLESVPGGEATIEQYEFEPIQGYPMLKWRGKRPFRSTQYYPAQLKESHGSGESGWRDKLYWGDNLQVMGHLLKEFRSKVDLVYIDPPFDSRADYKRTISLRGKSISNERTSFEEKQYTDIWANDEYLQFMYERLILIKELMSDSASIYLHCDYRKSHYLKLIMDEVFGANQFKNEIVWVRTNAHNMKSKGYVRSNDHILFYTKTDQFTFNEQYLPYGDSQLKEYREDENGRLYTTRDLTFSGANSNRQFEWRGTTPPPNRSWGASFDQLEEWLEEGRIELGKNGKAKMRGFKVFLEETKGNPVTSNWSDIIRVGNTSGERLNYPTQKPESLLERIVQTSSNEGDLVFDCFCGSGTTMAVSRKLRRRAIAGDINLGAIQTTAKRLLGQVDGCDRQKDIKDLSLDNSGETFSGFDVLNVNNYDVFRNPVEAKELLMQALEIQRIDGSKIYDGEKDGRMVKIMPVNRISTKADLNELIAGFEYEVFDRRQTSNPNQAVEKLLLVCMGHEAGLAATLQSEVNYKLDIEVVDILRDKSNLEFKRDSEAKIEVVNGELVIKKFYPMNLLQKLSLQKEHVEDWRALVESVMIDWNFDGAVLSPVAIDLPEKNELVSGKYKIPDDAGTIRVKITDVLSESLEMDVVHG